LRKGSEKWFEKHHLKSTSRYKNRKKNRARHKPIIPPTPKTKV